MDSYHKSRKLGSAVDAVMWGVVNGVLGAAFLFLSIAIVFYGSQGWYGLLNGYPSNYFGAFIAGVLATLTFVLDGISTMQFSFFGGIFILFWGALSGIYFLILKSEKRSRFEILKGGIVKPLIGMFGGALISFISTILWIHIFATNRTTITQIQHSEFLSVVWSTIVGGFLGLLLIRAMTNYFQEECEKNA